ncbi:bifunctional diaminohydroxyphosphoribosylaminopyrimidine deaminase/5-amino-6-(5-phosphoribosylamino)uracil reductase RibD [Subtercola endophyticus]|uniref:bifunctional diaminohydroxyphosphoribosylaminopyrimidine deaminase/5-amino-6-(5-phosphoribosylamino)uracil reductase RibD n=1 Tax=Subtercola endophyticus TaxID=2895559 RepID=UPI001E3518C5|nr:bifunctional diaminohydroxyphosphoribosylaminopyrimidine deaminase/5-amino-6-(5-phosphoribosylamino)uracil reductase RibD [Subtercola endophyticus]
MQRAIDLSQNGPTWGGNPQVGCVLLSPDGRTLAEGWHRGAGTPHAEVDALSKLTRASGSPEPAAPNTTTRTTTAPQPARGATAVITLEPCNHTGRTGPCAQALIDAGIAEVYFAVADPGAESSGGASALRAAGVRVHQGLLAEQVEQSIHPWLTAMRNRRPYVTLKWASSLDGRTAAADGTSQWVTGPDARSDVHTRRSASDAIVVATGTLEADDPSLTARDRAGALLAHQPVAVVVGRRGIRSGARLHEHPLPVLEYRTRDVHAVLGDLFARGIRSAFVEGGPSLASALLSEGLVDELVIYLAPMLLGGPHKALTDLGIASMRDAQHLDIASIDLLGPDLRIVARPRSRPAAAQNGPPVAARAETPRPATHPTPAPPKEP